MQHRSRRRSLSALLLLGTATASMADAISHVESWARAWAPNAYDEQVKQSQPYWTSAASNRLSTFAHAEGLDSRGLTAQVTGASNARADFSAVHAEAESSAAGLDPFDRPAATSSASASGILQMHWTVTGASGTFGTISVSGGLFAGGFVDANQPNAGQGSAQAVIVAMFGKEQCYDPACGQMSQLELKLQGRENIDGPPIVGTSYTLAVDVKPGDHLYLQYLATASASAGYHAWVGTTPNLSFPGDARAARSVAMTAAETPSFAQMIRLTGGLGLDGAEGLTQLGDGIYGFGSPAVVPEPGRWTLMLGGLALLALRCARRPGNAA